jgi:hypothetical protein
MLAFRTGNKVRITDTLNRGLLLVRRLLTMDTVRFLTVETTDKDLILSFAVIDPSEATDIDSLILLRTPLYEPLLEDWERGVRVSFERHDPEEDDFLEEVHWDMDTASIRLKTHLHTYRLDLGQVDGNSLSAMRKMLRKMNFDGRIQLSGV